MRAVALFTLASLLLATPGCFHEADFDLDAGAFEPDDEVAPEPVVVREVTVDWERAGARPAAPALPASPLDRVQPDPVPFEIGAGYGALGRVDLAPCRDKGLPPGYLRMRVTFERAGRVTHATVESAAPPAQAALACVAGLLQGAAVPRFDGRDATLTRTLFVRGVRGVRAGATPPPPAQQDDGWVRKGPPPEPPARAAR